MVTNHAYSIDKITKFPFHVFLNALLCSTASINPQAVTKGLNQYKCFALITITVQFSND